MKECPHCWNSIQNSAVKCKFCKEFVDVSNEVTLKTKKGNKFTKAIVIVIVTILACIGLRNRFGKFVQLPETKPCSYYYWANSYYNTSNNLCECKEWYIPLSWTCIEKTYYNYINNIPLSPDETCKNIYWLNSYGDWTKLKNWEYKCGCYDWYILNSVGDKCISQ